MWTRPYGLVSTCLVSFIHSCISGEPTIWPVLVLGVVDLSAGWLSRTSSTPFGVTSRAQKTQKGKKQLGSGIGSMGRAIISM